MFSIRKRAEFYKWFADDVREYLNGGLEPETQRTYHAITPFVSRYGNNPATITTRREHAIQYDVIKDDVVVKVWLLEHDAVGDWVIPAAVFCSPYFNKSMLFNQIEAWLDAVTEDAESERRKATKQQRNVVVL